MKKYNKIIRNILWMTAEYITRLVGGLVISATVARQLGVEQYGFFQYSMSLVLIFSALTFVCGAEVIVPKLVHANEKEKQSLMGNAFVLRLIFSCIAYMLLILYAAITESTKDLELIAILGTSLLMTEAFAVITAWLQSQTNNKPRSILVTFSILIKAIFVYALYLLDSRDPREFALAWAIESILIAFGLLIIYKKHHRELFFQFSRNNLLILLKEGAPFLASLLISYMFLRLDVFMLKNIGDLYTLGLYASASQLLLAMTAFSGILVSSMAPTMIYQNQASKYIKKNTLIITGILTIFAVTSAALISWLAPLMLPILFGDAYTNATSILIALAWASIFYFIDAALNVYLIQMKKGSWMAWKWIAAIACALPVHAYSIPRYNAYGAIAGYAAGYAVACAIGIFYLLTTENDIKSAKTI